MDWERNWEKRFKIEDFAAFYLILKTQKRQIQWIRTIKTGNTKENEALVI